MFFDLSSSVWERTAVPPPPAEPITQAKECDVAIIGGGYTGLSAALYLADHGTKAIVLESGELGAGASGRNGGQIVPGLKYDPEDLLKIAGTGRGEALLEYAGGGAKRTFDLISHYQLDCDARQCGWLQPAVTELQFQIVRRRAEQWRSAAGVASRILGRDEVRAATGTAAYAGGWVDPRGGMLQPLSYVRELARAAIARGAEVHTLSHVDALDRSNGRWQLKANEHRISADTVILATNAYFQSLVSPLNSSLFASHSVQIATEPLSLELRESIVPSGMPVSDSRRLLKYFRFDPEGRFLIGGRGSFGQHESGRYFAGLRAVAERMFPGLAGVSWSDRWAGRIALTLDHLPHIHNPGPQLYAAAGYNGRGVAMATQTGILLARLCLGLNPSESPLPLTPIRRIPFHLVRRPALEAAVLWYRLLDRLGR